MTVRCPDNLVLATDGRPIVGCGTEIPDVRDDEGWVDCPNCGLGFNPRPPREPGTRRQLRRP